MTALAVKSNTSLESKGFQFLSETLIAFIAISTVLLMQLLFRIASVILIKQWNVMNMIRPFYESLATAFLEEFFLRVLLRAFLLRFLSNKVLAVLIGSLVFALLHAGNYHVTAVALVSHFFGGLVYSYGFEGGLISIILRFLILCFLIFHFKKMFLLKKSSVSRFDEWE